MDHSKNELIDFKHFFSLLGRHKWVIITFLICSVASAYALVNYYFMPVYSSSATVFISSSESSLPKSDSGIGQIVSSSFDAQSGGFTAQNAIYLFKSRELSDEVAKQLNNIDTQSSDSSSYPLLWQNYPEDASPVSVEKIAGRIRGGLKVEPVELGSNLLRVSFESYSPQEAARVVNFSVNTFQDLTLEKRRESAESALTFLREKKQQTKTKLQNAEDRQNDFMNRKNLVELESRTQNQVNSLSNLEAERQTISIKLESANEAIKNYEKQIESIKPGLTDEYTKALGPTLNSYQQRLGDLMTKRFILLSNNPQLKKNPDSAPELTKLNKQISDLKAEIQKVSQQMFGKNNSYSNFVGDGSGGLRQELASLQSKLTDLRIQKNQYQAQIDAFDKRIGEAKMFLKGVPKNKVQLARLDREVETYKKLLESISKQETEVSLWKQTQSSSGKIYDYATVSGIPVKPQKVLWLAASILLGLVIPIGFVSVKDYFGSTISGMEQLKAYPYKLLPVIYDFSLLKGWGSWIKSKNGKGKSDSIAESIIMYHNPMSPITESYHRMAGDLLFSGEKETLKKAIITSSGIEEGKTTITANLGWALAELDNKVLIVDCDLRRPALHKNFNLSLSPGITDVINGKKKLSGAINETLNSNLSVLTAGEKSANPAQLVRSKSFFDLIQTLESHYDLILFDTPPYGIVSDIDRLTTITDYVVVVSRFKETKESVLNSTLEDLSGDLSNEKIGLVLNRYKPAKSTDSYGTKGLYDYKYQGYNDYKRTTNNN